jgi:polyisoprenoid-binding protein YceI
VPDRLPNTFESNEESTMKIIKRNTGVLLAVTLAATAFAVPAHAQTSTWVIDPAHSSVNFEIIHLGVSHVHGAFGNVTGTVTLNEKDITKSSVMATIDTTTVSTGVAARDTHLKSPDFFDIAKNPTMTFKSTSLSNAGKLQLIGDLTINGVTKSVTLDLDGPTPPQTVKDKIVSGFSASGKLSRKDFGFGPKYSPPTLGDDVKFTVDVEIDKK